MPGLSLLSSTAMIGIIVGQWNLPEHAGLVSLLIFQP
jgi:hypothetical protein